MMSADHLCSGKTCDPGCWPNISRLQPPFARLRRIRT